MILLRVDCEYPDMPELEPTSITFQPVGLGDSAAAVHEAFRRLLLERDRFEVEGIGEPYPVEFNSATVRRVVDWEEA